MQAFIEQNWQDILFWVIVVAIALLVVCIIKKLFRIALALFVLGVVVPALFTIFWGDGHAYVEEIASFLTDEHRERIVSIYDYFKEKDAEDPIIDYDAVSNTVTDIFSQFRDKVDNYLPSFPPLPTPSA